MAQTMGEQTLLYLIQKGIEQKLPIKSQHKILCKRKIRIICTITYYHIIIRYINQKMFSKIPFSFFCDTSVLPVRPVIS